MVSAQPPGAESRSSLATHEPGDVPAGAGPPPRMGHAQALEQARLKVQGSSVGATAQSQLLAAWSDRVAGVIAYSAAITTENMFGDGYRLIIADEDRKLKVWNGHVREAELVLLDTPVAVLSFNVAGAPQPRLAVAAGMHVYVYSVGAYNALRPFYKVTLPMEEVDEAEEAVWAEAAESGGSSEAIVAALRALAERGVPLCRRSRTLLEIPDALTANAFLVSWLGRPLVAASYITALARLYLGVPAEGAPSTLLISTEAGTVCEIDNTTLQVMRSWELDGVPAALVAHGSLQGGYTAFAALRTPFVRVIQDGELDARRIALDAQAVAICLAGANLHVAISTATMTLYDVASRSRVTGVPLPAPPLAMATLPHGSESLVAVAMRDLSVVIYNRTVPISCHSTSTRVLGMFAGPLMSEEAALVTVLEGGHLEVRFLSRRAKLTKVVAKAAIADAENRPLPVPKKTKLCIEFAKRERENAQSLYHAFQQDLLKLRLRTAEAYVKVLTGAPAPGNGALVSRAAAQTTVRTGQISLVTSLAGLGPHFRLAFKVVNRSKRPMTGVLLLVSANEELYELSARVLPLPALVSSLQYEFTVDVVHKDPAGGAADNIAVVIKDHVRDEMLTAADISMPVSEVDFE